MRLPKLKLPFKTGLIAKVGKVYTKVMSKVKPKAPEIFLGAGIITGIGTVIFVGVNTWKNKDLLQDDANDIKLLKSYDPEEHLDEAILSEEEVEEELHKAYKSLWKDILRTYWLPGILGTSSLIFIISGHRILRKELAAMTTSYALLLDSYNKYRQRVIDDIGVEKDQEYMHGIKMVDTIDPETGETIKKAIIDKRQSVSRYARYFDEGNYDSTLNRWIWRNPHWCANKLECARRVKFIQSTLNDQFRIKGWMKLNEAYTAYGLPCTEEGEHVGWVLGSGHDDCIDVGVFPNMLNKDRQLPINKLFLDIHNMQNTCLLDFNVDGCIDYIFKDMMEYDNRSYICNSKRGKLE